MNHSPSTIRGRPSERGLTLVEVTLAIGVATFCLVAIFGLLPVGLKSNQDTIEQTVAASLARGVIADLRATPKTNPPSAQKSPQYQITIPGTGSGKSTVFLNEDTTAKGASENTNADPSLNPRYRVALTFKAPADASQKEPTMVALRITWPALADKSWNAEPQKFSGSYEIATALDRN